ncbi:11107_t:CDS:1, partial [Gigaspora rosea]
EDGVFSYTEDNVHAFRDYLADEEVWYIVDGKRPMDYITKTIPICSPRKATTIILTSLEQIF